MKEETELKPQWFEVSRVTNGWLVRSHRGGWDQNSLDTRSMHVFNDAGALAAWVLEQTGGDSEYSIKKESK